MEIEAYGQMLHLKWHFRNDEKEFDRNMFKPKSTFNPRNKDAAIEINLSSLEEKLMNIEIAQNKYNNITREKRSAPYNLKNDKNIVIKSADKGSAVVVWDRDDYIKETTEQFGDKDIYKEVRNDPGPLISTIHEAKFLLAFSCSRKYINDYMMLQVDLLFQTADIIPKTYLFFRLSFAIFGPGSKILHKRY